MKSNSKSTKMITEQELNQMDPDKRNEVLDSIPTRRQLGGKWYLKLIIIPDDMFGKIKVEWDRKKPSSSELLAVENYTYKGRVVSVRNRVIPIRHDVEGLPEFKRHFYLDLKTKTVESDFICITDFQKNFLNAQTETAPETETAG
jgi:hypothetical protein